MEFHTPTPADGVTHSLLITSDVGITSLSQTTCVSCSATCIYSWILVFRDPRLVLHPLRHIRPADRDLLPPPRSIEPRLPPSPTTWSVNPDLAIRSNPIRPCPGIRISPMKPSCQSYTTLFTHVIRILHASFRYTIGKLHANRLTTRVNRSPPAFPRPNSRFPYKL